MVLSTIAAFVVGFSVLAGVARAEPEVFSKAGYEADRSTAVQSEKLHVLYFTASWCPPCKQMKKTTWVDESVVSWLDDNAVVTAIDVDEEQKLAQAFRVRAMPTMVILREGEEIARTVGYQGSVEFRDWLERADAGLIVSPATAFALPANGELVDVDAKLNEARDFVNTGKLNEATKAYAWLWDNMLLHDEAFVGVRGSFMALDMERLAAEHAAAYKAFKALRDREQALLEQGDVTWDRLDDWIVLNEVIEDDESTLAWVERNVVERQNPSAIGRLGFRVQPLLVEHKRYDILALIADPVFEARRQIEMLNYSRRAFGIDPSREQNDESRAILEQHWRETLIESAGIWFTVALDAGNRDAAGEIAGMLLESDDSIEMQAALTNAAKEAGAEMISLPD